MKLQFKCTLTSDLILNIKSATQGQNRTLDFIPGNNFLGIVAANYEQFSDKEAFEIFHSGKVRFGDGHLAYTDNERIVRTHKVPASVFYPKSKSIVEECYLYHFYKRENDKVNQGFPQQLKQARDGFYAFLNTGNAMEVKIAKSFSQKSAYDPVNRRSLDEMMYGFESIKNGTVFAFDVEIDNPKLVDKIRKALVGNKRIGKSKSAEYGSAFIQECNYSESISTNTLHKDFNIVYADSRLIFVDSETLMPSLQPTAKDLGFNDPESEIVWELSQIRTFHYSPWNSTRNSRDADRCGIEKGSVFVVKTKEIMPEAQYVGSFSNEGFGKVFYNPEFLILTNGNGLSEYKYKKHTQNKQITKGHFSSPLTQYLHKKKEYDECCKKIFTEVNVFVNNNKAIFKGDTFASQWGNIRSIAQQNPTKDKIIWELFDKSEKVFKPKTKTDEEKWETVMKGYLTHGIAERKWKQKGRRDLLFSFIETISQKIGSEYVQKAVVNLASEMAKICK